MQHHSSTAGARSLKIGVAGPHNCRSLRQDPQATAEIRGWRRRLPAILHTAENAHLVGVQLGTAPMEAQEAGIGGDRATGVPHGISQLH